MRESPPLIAELRTMAGLSVPAAGTGADLLNRWPEAGLPRGRLHEIYAGTADDNASGAGFAVALALAARATPLLWLRTEKAERRGGRVHATGLAELGFDAAALVLAVVADVPALLRAAADAARCGGLGMVLAESWGPAPDIDLTATRRLMLAAETSGVTVAMLRVDATPVASAAASRWSVSAVPSIGLPVADGLPAPGLPAFDIELLRRRGGPAGARWQVEWNRDSYQFQPRTPDGDVGHARGHAGGRAGEQDGGQTPLPGAAIPMGAGRAVAGGSAAPFRRTG